MITATLRHLRIAPRKVRLVADLLRGKSVSEAQVILNFTVKKASQPLLKLLNSAVSGAKNNFKLDSANLYISKITVDEGPKLKRWRARARGSANEILKKTSQVMMVLDVLKTGKSDEKRSRRISGPLTPGVDGETPSVAATPKEKPKPKLKADYHVKKPMTSGAIKKIFRRQVF